MPKISTEQKFKRNDRVVAVRDLPGVPAGTPGRVYYEAGLTWFRYHVRFDNGTELANVDGGDLVLRKEWEAQQAEAERDARRREREAERARLAASVVPGQGGGH